MFHQKQCLKKKSVNEFFVTENKPVISEQGYGFKEYTTYVPPEINVEYNMRSLADHIIKTVKIEQPVHFDVVCQRLCGLIGRRQKVTSVVQNAISRSMRFINTQIKTKDNFMYLSNSSTEYDVRLAGVRQIQYIAIDELAKGMLRIIDANIGLTKDELFHETSRAFGFNRIGNSIAERLNKALLFLEASKKVIIKDDKVLGS